MSVISVRLRHCDFIIERLEVRGVDVVVSIGLGRHEQLHDMLKDLKVKYLKS